MLFFGRHIVSSESSLSYVQIVGFDVGGNLKCHSNESEYVHQ